MEKENSKLIPIVLATDDNFAPYCSVTICSIIKTATPEREYRIYVFQNSLSRNNIDILESLSTANVIISCFDVSEFVRPDLMYETDLYPRPTYFRLLVAEILPQYEKLIYLDCDIVVVSDLSQLYDIQLHGNILGAILDIQNRKRQKETKSLLGIDAYMYFNSGVLLIDNLAFSEERIKEKCYDILKTRKDFWLPDQDALNLACLGRVLYLPMRWNFMAEFCMYPFFNRKGASLNKQYKEALSAPSIVHYAGNSKPDKLAYLGINRYFWTSAADSPLFWNLYKEWLKKDDNSQFLRDINEMYRDIMLAGKCGWRGLFEITVLAFRSRIEFLVQKKANQ